MKGIHNCYRNRSFSFMLMMLTLAATAFAQTAFAQSGSLVVPFPESGSWFNADAADRTGFNMEVQDGILSGAYYGYDGQGNQAWLLFSGPLDFAPTGFVFSGELTRSSGGGCIVDCDNANTQSEHSVEVAGMLDIEFLGRSSARFRIDDGEFQPINVLSYGTSAQAVFPEFPEVQVHNFTGTWLLEMKFLDQCGNFEAATVVRISDQQIDQSAPGNIRFDFAESVFDASSVFTGDMSPVTAAIQQKATVDIGLAISGSDEVTPVPQCSPAINTFPQTGELQCLVSNLLDENASPKPVCVISADPNSGVIPDVMLVFDPTSSSDVRIEGEARIISNNNNSFFGAGFFTAHRLNYD